MTTPELKSRLTKSLDFFKNDVSQIRTGRATPALIENISVNAYDTKMTLKELGSIIVLDSQNLVVSPWDKSTIKDIAAAIKESELQVDPVVDGDTIRIPIPALTEERRKDFVKLVSTKVEEAKNSMRNIRQEAMKDIEKDFTDKKIGEDDKFAFKAEVEEVMKDFVKKLEESAEIKKQELLKI